MGIAWESVLLQDDIDVIRAGIKDSIVNILNLLCPLKWIKVVTNKPIWLNSELFGIAKQRDRLFQIYQQSKRTCEDIFREAVKTRREFNRLSKLGGENFYRDQLMYNKTDQVVFW